MFDPFRWAGLARLGRETFLEDKLTLITGQVSDVGMNDASGLFYARAAEFRGDGAVVVTPAPATFTVKDGAVSANIAPGPTVITLHVGPVRKDWFVNVPEADIGLGDLIATYTTYEPAVVSAAIAARDAAIEAESEAKQAAIDAEAKRVAAETAANLTGQDRLHVDNVRALLDETYDESQAGQALPPRLTETALNATYEASFQVNVNSFGASQSASAATNVAAIRSACDVVQAAGGGTLHFPDPSYAIQIDGSAHRNNLYHFTGLTGVRITGGATLNDATVYSIDKLANIFAFTRCADVDIDMRYMGVEIAEANKENHLGRIGATFAYFEDHCTNPRVRLYGENLRYGVRSGDYLNTAYGECAGFDVEVRGKNIGYPIALTLATVKRLHSEVDGFHRSVYLAGCAGDGRGLVTSNSRNQYGAVIYVLCTNAITTYSTVQSEQRARGCSNLDIFSTDSGSTKFLPQSTLTGLALQWVAEGTEHRNLSFTFSAKTSNTIASTVGGFMLESTVTDVPFKWEPYIVLDNIKVSGTIDRAGQTAATNSLGEIYVRAYDPADTTNAHSPKVKSFAIQDVSYTKGTVQTRPWFVELPGLVDTVTLQRVQADGVAIVSNAPGAVVAMKSCKTGPLSAANPGSIGTLSLDDTLASSLVADRIAGVVYANRTGVGWASARSEVTPIQLATNGTATVTAVGALKRGAIVKGLVVRISYSGAPPGKIRVGTAVSPARFGEWATISGTNRLTAGTGLPYYHTGPDADLRVTFVPDDGVTFPNGPAVQIAIYAERFTIDI